MFKSKKILLLSACLLSMQSLFSYDIDNLGKRIQATDVEKKVVGVLYDVASQGVNFVNTYGCNHVVEFVRMNFVRTSFVQENVIKPGVDFLGWLDSYRRKFNRAMEFSDKLPTN